MNHEAQLGQRVSLITIILNALLATVKIAMGIIGKSSVLVADGMHSFTDLVTTIGVLLGFRVARKEADRCHPYGHEKIESVIAIVLSAILMVTALYISFQAFILIISGKYTIPSTSTIYIALGSIFIKEMMFWYTHRIGVKISSPMLIADAWHHRSDALSSIAALGGIVGSIYLGWHYVEQIATIIIGVIIVKVSVDIYLRSAREVIDRSADEDLIDLIYRKLDHIPGIKEVDDLKTRTHVNKVYVEIEIAVDGQMSLTSAHDIAESVHLEVEELDERIKHCVVHVNPF